MALEVGAEGIRLSPTMYASLPTDMAKAAGILLYCPDHPSGPQILLGNGSAWQTIARVVHTTILTTPDTTGLVTWTFQQAFNAAAIPVIDATVVTEGGAALPKVVEIVKGTLTNTSVQLRVRQAQKLPAVISLLGALAGYDVWAGATPAGIQIHCRASYSTG